jgi:glycosyltransferase involved in cell wall biosynthesis
VPDLAVVGQDPGFGGGVRTMTAELFLAAEQLGRSPELHYLRYRNLDATRPASTFRGHAVRPLVPGVDAANVLGASVGIGRAIRDARAAFVCAAVASHGFGAVVSRRPFACWVTTSLTDEWASRRQGLPRSRRTALTVGGPVLRRLERETLRHAVVVWATSPAARDVVAETAGLGPGHVRHVPIPVDTELFAPLPEEEWRHALEQPQLIFIGRADDPRKNLPLLLDAFMLLRRRRPEATLTLVGEAPRAALPEGVVALGQVPSVVEPLRRAALFVLPSLQEGFGIVVAEALACGVPVLVTPSGGPEELVRESGGGEVLSGFEPEELAARGEALLADPVHLAVLRERGRAYVVREHDRARLRNTLAETLDGLEQ